ncbi:MAG: molybdopterin dinucleotide binding domain-containing protein, partial [Gemmatimonadales bacterium]
GSPYLDIVTPDTAAPLEYPLRLLPYKFSTLSSGSMRWERWLLEQPSNMHEIHYDPWVEVGPATARELDLAEGSAVWVVSRQGRCQARVTISSGTAPHTVCVPYGPVHADGRVANPLRLLVNESDPLTGLQSWFTTFVRLERAQGEGG